MCGRIKKVIGVKDAGSWGCWWVRGDLVSVIWRSVLVPCAGANGTEAEVGVSLSPALGE